jgi:hypothetical protein
MALTRLACTVAAALLLAATAVGSAAAYPRYQPSSIAFLDRQHGVLAKEDWSCGKQLGCPAQILVSSDGGGSWKVTYRATMPVRLTAVRDTQIVWASTGTNTIVSRDGGLHWRRAFAAPETVSFANAAYGWRLAAGAMLDRPPALLASADGGKSWRPRVNPCRGDYGLTIGFSFVNASRGWLVCATQASTGFQGKEVWESRDGARSWALRSRVHPIGPPNPALRLGNLPGFGYPTGLSFLPNGRGWLWEDRGWLLTSNNGGARWRKAAITQPDQVAATSATLLSDKLGFVLLRGCSVKLVRTDDAGSSWQLLKRWKSPTTC